ncbi:MAG TPA: IS30 family transposase [Burkholderiales bacterium]|nr:IS30 family transposase [Burkholderiales bacterium]
MSRRRFTPEERAALWRGWKSGLTLSEIGQGLNRRAVSVLNILRRAGGFEPRTRRRAARSLKAGEREEISRGLAAGLAVREIARQLGRAACTVSREIGRNGGRHGYRAADADARAWQRARRPQACLLARRPWLRNWVAERLQRDWSPRQIAIGLERTFAHDGSMRVSHETIYRSLFVQARNVLKKELLGHLRRGGFMRRPRTQPGAQPTIVDGISIHQRPAEVEERAVPGHWEGDLLMGGASSQIATLVERHSRYLMLVKVDRKDTGTVTQALAQKIRQLPAELRRSLTWDRGSEMAAHKDFTVATDVQVYFCDPHSPWQRGSNENTNGLLRQYFPKGQDVSHVTQAELNRVARLLNERPRETLNWLTPLEALRATVASTG